MTVASHLLRRALVLVGAGLLLAAVPGCGGSDSATTRATVTYDAALHQSLPADVRARGSLRIETEASYAPAEAFAPDGRTIVGFEPDLADAVGHILGVQVRFVDQDFSTLLDRLRHGRADAVMSALTDTPERERDADFITYFSAGTSIVVKRGNSAGITDLVGLCGHTVAVEKDTTQVDLLRRSQKQCPPGKRTQIKSLDTNADALLQLRTGHAQAVLNDYPPAVALTTDPRTRGQYQLASTEQYEPGLYGIAVAKGNTALREALTMALEKLMRSGDYTEILRRWEVSNGAVSTVSINAARLTPLP